MKSLNIEIAGIVTSFYGIPGKALKALKKRFAGFICKNEGDLKWTVEWGTPANENGPWDIRCEYDPAKWIFRRGDFCAEWKPSENAGTVLMAANENILDTLLTTWLSMLMVERGGGLFTGVGVSVDGKGFFYAGASQKDRKAIAGKFKAKDVISGDVVALYRKDGMAVICGASFGGDGATNGKNLCAPIEKISLLGGAGDENNGSKRLSSSEASMELWGSIIYTSRSIDMQNKTMSICDSLATLLPCERL